MAFLVTKDMETGNQQIDKEHVELFSKINDFMEACGQGKGRDEILQTVDFLRKYTRTHFTNEERLQQMSGYPHLASHKAFHDQFISNLETIAQKIQSEGVSVSLVGSINIQLGSALIAHIKTEDVKLAKFVKEKSAVS